MPGNAARGGRAVRNRKFARPVERPAPRVGCIACECLSAGPEEAEGAMLGALTVLGLVSMVEPENVELGKRGALGILDHVCELHREVVVVGMQYAIETHGKKGGA
jgi:hypothetical protein